MNNRKKTKDESFREFYDNNISFVSQKNEKNEKLLTLLNECNRQSLHMQRLYKRRKLGDDGIYRSNWSILRTGNNDPS